MEIGKGFDFRNTKRVSVGEIREGYFVVSGIWHRGRFTFKEGGEAEKIVCALWETAFFLVGILTENSSESVRVTVPMMREEVTVSIL